MDDNRSRVTSDANAASIVKAASLFLFGYVIGIYPWLLAIGAVLFVAYILVVGDSFWVACLRLLASAFVLALLAAGFVLYSAGTWRDPLGSELLKVGGIGLGVTLLILRSISEERRTCSEIEWRKRHGSMGRV